MVPDAKGIVEAAYRAWGSRDILTAMVDFSDDVVLVLHLPKELMPTAGEIAGKRAVIEAFQGILDQFEFIEYQPVSLAVAGSRVECTVHFHYRHKLSGEHLESDMRHQWTIEGGKVVRLEEWHDLGRLKPFFTAVAMKLS